jgi:hypothetical protein
MIKLLFQAPLAKAANSRLHAAFKVVVVVG